MLQAPMFDSDMFNARLLGEDWASYCASNNPADRDNVRPIRPGRSEAAYTAAVGEALDQTRSLTAATLNSWFRQTPPRCYWDRRSAPLMTEAGWKTNE